MNPSQVIRVNEQDEPIGVMEKLEAHRTPTLHRAFSVFIRNSRGEWLLQQRAEDKYHSPGLWTNTCCSHPAPGQDTLKAAERRLQDEMGFATPLQEIFSFTYQADFDNGLTEYEYDHVFIGTYDGPIHPDPLEVQDYSFLTTAQILTSLQQDPDRYTPWFRIAFPRLLSV